MTPIDRAFAIAGLLNMRIACDAFAYFVEPYEVPAVKNPA